MRRQNNCFLPYPALHLNDFKFQGKNMSNNFILCAALGAGFAVLSLSVAAANPSEKVYIALEGEGKVAVLDTKTRQIVKQIDLTESSGEKTAEFAPHNVQVAPDGKTVWVTANIHADHDAHEQSGHLDITESVADQAIVIDPQTDSIAHRIPIAPKAHLSHVVVSPDGRTAYVNAQEQHRIYKIDAATFRVHGYTSVAGQGPHGLRLSPDGSKAYIAMLQGHTLGIMDTASGGIHYAPVGGAAVQSAVTPDGKIAMVSVYDAKRLILYNAASGRIDSVALPADAKGPVQMYPTPDSRYAYVADQGYYFKQPVGGNVYKIDLHAKRTVETVKAGKAPHGVVVSKDGRRVYVTNLLSNDVSVIDTASDREVARIPVGKEPNGVSIWSATAGGTP
jgi:YVTN family beta-propeller protein